ncbi:MAG: hypothetical protein ABSG59_08675 [Verrucomicrobiota bacterium]|jgi:hypothetical protein
MMRNLVLTIVAGCLAVSCASNSSYQPNSDPEQIEFKQARLDVYPEDVRNDPSRYTNTLVVWPGVIRSTHAQDEDYRGRIRAETVLEHHYFDWKQDHGDQGVKLLLSRRGEGAFRVRWHLVKTGPDATSGDAETYAGRNKLAIVYGTPESVDADGTVVLQYRYMRAVDRAHYSVNQMDYGRLGEWLTNSAVATAPSH